MQKYYRERFEAWRRIARQLASSMETNHVLEILRAEARDLIPDSMESCILLLDPVRSGSIRFEGEELLTVNRATRRRMRIRTSATSIPTMRKDILCHRITRPPATVTTPPVTRDTK